MPINAICSPDVVAKVVCFFKKVEVEVSADKSYNANIFWVIFVIQAAELLNMCRLCVSAGERTRRLPGAAIVTITHDKRSYLEVGVPPENDPDLPTSVTLYVYWKQSLWPPVMTDAIVVTKQFSFYIKLSLKASTSLSYCPSIRRRLPAVQSSVSGLLLVFIRLI